MTMNKQMHQRAIDWLNQAADLLRATLDSPLQVKQKQNARDLVTEMDCRIEDYLIQQIRHYYPNHQILSEEGQGDVFPNTEGYLWIIDPIDGTLNYVKEKNHFAILLGIYYNGKPVAGYIVDVMNEQLYYGIVGDGVYLNHQPLLPIQIASLETSLIHGNVHLFIHNRYQAREILNHSLGMRHYGAAGLDMISVIRGEAALYLSPRLQPWDFAAGLAIFTAMNYKMTTPTGQPLDLLKRQAVLACHPAVHSQVLDIIQSTDSEANNNDN